MLLMRKLKILLVISGEVRLNFPDLFSHAFILHLDFEKVLHSIVSIELAFRGLVLKPILRPAHLDLALESLKRFEH
jgi:hypothetical protein